MKILICITEINYIKKKHNKYFEQQCVCVCVCIQVYIYIYIYTVGTESIQTPLNFSLFVILQPFAKII